MRGLFVDIWPMESVPRGTLRAREVWFCDFENRYRENFIFLTSLCEKLLDFGAIFSKNGKNRKDFSKNKQFQNRNKKGRSEERP